MSAFAWLNHLGRSPYCHKNYPIFYVGDRATCVCGWQGPVEIKEEKKPKSKAMSLGDLIKNKCSH